MPCQVVILGGGISGLACAWSLKKRWGPRIHVTILEKQDRTGGWIQSIEKDGFLFELGPRSCRSKGAGYATLQLVEELGLQEDVIVNHPSAQQRYIYWNQALHRIPSHPFSFSPLLKGLRRAFYQDLIQPKRLDAVEESVEEFFSRRFNAAFAQRLIDPFVSGIYAGDMKRLSLEACFPFLKELERTYRSLIWGMWRSKKEKISASPFIRSIQAAPLFSFKNGMETLINRLSSRLEADIRLKCWPVSMELDSKGCSLMLSSSETLKADYVISALPAGALGSLIAPHQPLLEKELAKIPYATVAVVSLGYKRPILKKKGFGYLIPYQEKEDILGCVWDSQVFPQQSPGFTRLTVMLGGRNHPEFAHLSEEQCLSRALSALGRHLNISDPPDVFHVNMARQAIPQYEIGYAGLRNHIQEQLHNWNSRLILLGNAFCGISVNDCVQSVNYLKLNEFLE